MSRSGTGDQEVSLPSGGAEVHGLGETFQPDQQTGTGNYRIDIDLPQGRRNSTPALALTYSTGQGNGPFGLGWSLRIPSILRATDKGVPIYDDRRDTFVLSGADDLVPIDSEHRRYRPRTEGLFARIEHIGELEDDHWSVMLPDGTRQIFGGDQDSRIVEGVGAAQRIYGWLLSETVDAVGNRIVYSYKSDRDDDLGDINGHVSNQTYLKSISYVEYADELDAERWLYRVRFDYGEKDEGWDLRSDAASEYRVNGTTPVQALRPDPFSFHRGGFEVRTRRRCRAIEIQVLLAGATTYETIRTYSLEYESDQRTHTSRLIRVTLSGQRPAVNNGQHTDSRPPLTLGYTGFDPSRHRLLTLEADGGYLPERALDDPEYELIDLNGYGLPGVIHTDPLRYRYWENRGGGCLASPRDITSFPAGVSLAQPEVQLADMEGNGSADLLVTAGPRAGYYLNNFEGQWQTFWPYRQAPLFNLEDPDVRLVDIDGDGIIDVFATRPQFLEWVPNLGRLGWGMPKVIPRTAALRDVHFSAPGGRVTVAAVSGGGLHDIVIHYGGVIEYWPNFGRGNFGGRVTMSPLPGFEPHFDDPERFFFTDVNGDGFADLVYVAFDAVYLWLNQSGNGWSERITIEGTPPATAATIRVVDMLGTGIAGILWTYDASSDRRKNMRYLQFTDGAKQGLLSSIDNGIGAVTAISYRTSTDEYLRDRDSGLEWRTTLPFPVQVVAEMTVEDEVNGSRTTMRYAYHHGCWDGEEREFRGFGRVDRFDTPEKADRDPETDGLPSVTRTWYDTGIGVDFSNEWFPESADAHLLETQVQPRERDAQRALRGAVLRSEVYGLDGTVEAGRPFTVTDHRHDAVEIIEPGLQGPHSIWWSQERAERTATYERGTEPRVEARRYRYDDPYGGQTEEERIGYGRVPTAGPTGAMQSRTLRTVKRTTYLHRDVEPPSYDSHIDPPLYVVQLTEEIALSASEESGDVLISRTLNRYDDQQVHSAVDPFPGPGSAVTYGLLTGTWTLALKDNLIASAYGTQANSVQTELQARGGYFRDSSDGWWTGAQQRYRMTNGRPRFGVVDATIDARGGLLEVGYDAYDLHEIQRIDAGGYPTTTTYDYWAQAVAEDVDANGNVRRRTFDGLGRPLLDAVMGKRDPVTNLWSGDSVDYPTRQWEYHDLDFAGADAPAYTVIRQRIRRRTTGASTDDDCVVTYEYVDGSGRSIQRREAAELGPLDPTQPASAENPELADRVRISGWQVYNNQGNLVRKYQPSFGQGFRFTRSAPESWPFFAYRHDALGRVICTTWPDGALDTQVFDAWSQTSFDQNDNAARAADPLVNQQAGVFTSCYTTGVVDPLHLDTPRVVHIDAWNRRIAEWDDNAYVDSSGNPVARADAQDSGGNLKPGLVRQILRTVYDLGQKGEIRALHDARESTDSLGSPLPTFTYTYDFTSRELVRNNLTGSGTRITAFDAAANPIWTRDARDVIVREVFDALNRRTHLYADDMLREHRTYRAWSTSDAVGAANNLFGPVEIIHDQTGKLEFTYDFRGGVVTETRWLWKDLWNAWQDPTAGIWSTDAATRNPPIAESDFDGLAVVPGFPNGFRLQYTYDSRGVISSTTYPDGTIVERLDHERSGALKSIRVTRTRTTPTVLVGDLSYDALLRRTAATLANGTQTTYTYHPLTLRLAEILTIGQGGKALQHLAYAYDPFGNVRRRVDQLQTMFFHGNQYVSNTQTYSYDPTYRLLEATGRCHPAIDPFDVTFADRTPDPNVYIPYTHRYRYDAAGNLTRNEDYSNAAMDYDAGHPDLFIGAGSESGAYNYDAAGNLVASPRHQRLDYDHANRLEYADLGGGGILRLVFSAEGSRRLKLVRRAPGLLKLRLYIGDLFELGIVRTPSSMTTTTAVHVFDGKYRVATYDTGQVDTQVPGLLIYHSDALGTTHVLSDSTGRLFSQEEHYPWGALSDRRYARNRYGFLGKEREEEIGLCVFGSRLYDCVVGRWTTADPLGPVEGPNVYAYARDRPTVRADPTGTWSWGGFFTGLAILGAVVGLVALAVVTFGLAIPAEAAIIAGVVGVAAGAYVVAKAVNDRDAGRITDYEFSKRVTLGVGGALLSAMGVVGAAGAIGGGGGGAAAGEIGSISGTAGEAAAALEPALAVPAMATASTTAEATAGLGISMAMAASGPGGAGGSGNGEDPPKKGPIPDQEPASLEQKLAMDEAKAEAAAGRGQEIMRNLADRPRLEANHGPGTWVKMQYVHRSEDGTNVVIHWFRNLTTGQNIEFKFK